MAGRPRSAPPRAAPIDRAGCRACRGAGRRRAPRSRARARRGRPRRGRGAARRRRAGGRRGVQAALLDGRAEHVAAVAARDEVAPRACGSCASTRPWPRGSRRRRIWPLTGRTGTRAELARVHAPAATTTCPARGAASSSRSRRRRSPSRDLAAGARSHARRRARRRAARVDGAVAGDVEREPDGRGERGLGAARLARAQPLDREAEPLAERVAGARAPRPRRGRGRRRACRCGAAEVARRLELGAERRASRRRAQAEVEQRLLAELGLGDRREHARGVAPGAVLAARRARRVRRPRWAARHATARPMTPPPTTATSWCSDCEGTAYHPPFAGMTRIRFDGRRPGAALSARRRAPVMPES